MIKSVKIKGFKLVLPKINIQPLVRRSLRNTNNKIIIPNFSTIGKIGDEKSIPSIRPRLGVIKTPRKVVRAIRTIPAPRKITRAIRTIPLGKIKATVIDRKNDHILRVEPVKFNNVRPSYSSIRKQTNLIHDQRTDNAKTVTTKFTPYEKLTGISQIRPEILSLLSFEPMFLASHNLRSDKTKQLNVNMTNVGKFIDAQIQFRNLKIFNIVNMLKTLGENDIEIFDEFMNKNSEMKNSISQINDISTSLLDVVNSVDLLKSRLDLRDSIHTVEYEKIINSITTNYTDNTVAFSYGPLSARAEQFMPQKYNYVNILTRLGYKSDIIKNVFTSTKIWLQTLEEYKDIILNHSLGFLDIDSISQRSDSNATVLNKKDSNTFGFNSSDPNNGKIPFLNEIVGYDAKNVPTAVKLISDSYESLYTNVESFKTEEIKIAALANLISKEYNYSLGLQNPKIDSVLLKDYNTKVNINTQPQVKLADRTKTGNSSVFDSVIGTFTNNVFNIPVSTTTNSLTNISNKVDNNTAVLTFESGYIENTNGIITPGSRYYVDSVLQIIADQNNVKYNTGNIKNLAINLKDTLESFNVITNGLNIHGLSRTDENQKSQNLLKFDNPSKLVKELFTTLVAAGGETLHYIKVDKLSPLIALATTNVKLKSQLFLYFMNKMARSYSSDSSRSITPPQQNDNTAFLNSLIGDIIKTVSAITANTSITSKTTFSQNSNDITSDELKTWLQFGSYVTLIVNRILTVTLTDFDTNGIITKGSDRTVFGGHMDTTIMMSVFDLLITMIAKYCNQKFEGQVVTKSLGTPSNSNVKTYRIIATSTNFQVNQDDVINRLDKELALIQQITMCIHNTLQNLTNSSYLFSNSLDSENSVSTLNLVEEILDDISKTESLISKQQVTLLNSNAADLTSKLKDVPGNDQLNYFHLLDDSVFTKNLKNIFYSYFRNAEYSTKKALNKKVFSIGLPMNFVSSLKSKMRPARENRTSYVGKRNDIIEINIYKTDLLNQNIVFKPRKFLFELSRYPVRDSDLIKTTSPIINSSVIPLHLPTRSFTDTNSTVNYWDSQKSNLSTFSKQYDFLNFEQKEEIINNHIMSYLSEIYTSLLTGLKINDNSFLYDADDVNTQKTVDDDFVKSIIEKRIEQFISHTGNNSSNVKLTPGIFLSPARNKKIKPNLRRPLYRDKLLGNKIKKPGALQSSKFARFKYANDKNVVRKKTKQFDSLSILSKKKVSTALHMFRTVDSFTRMKTTLSLGGIIQRSVVAPRQFDRIFNVIVDRDDFEIDYDKTMETDIGKNTFNTLLSTGDITQSNRSFKIGKKSNILTTTVQGENLVNTVSDKLFNQSSSNFDSFAFAEKDKTQGDASFDKYFVAIKTLDLTEESL